MKRLGAVLIAVCMLLTCVTAVFGADAAEVSAALNFRDFSVEIQASGLEPLAQTSIVAVLENGNPFQVAESGAAAYIGQGVADADGGLRVSVGFRPDCCGGSYEICLIDSKTGVICRSRAFAYRSAEEMRGALDAVNQASEPEMTAALEACREGMLLDMSEYDTLGAGKQEVARMLYTRRPSGGFADIYAVHSAFGSCTAAAAVTGSADAGAILEKYGDALGIDLALLDACTAEARTYAMTVLAGKTYASPEALAAAYPEAVFAGRAARAKTVGELQDYFLNAYADVLKLDLTAYRGLSNPTKVFAALLGSPITGYQDAASRFDRAVSAQAQAEADSGKNNQDGGPGGGSRPGGGSSGGTGGGSPVSPGEGGVDTTPVEPDPYSDLSGVAWAREAILYLTDQNVISGDGNGIFRPNDSITRAEFVKILTTAFGFTDTKGELDFADVSPEEWYAPYVMAGVNAGIVKGMREDWFGAAEDITREDLIVMCERAAQTAGMELSGGEERTLADAESISDYARDAVSAFCSAGIISGDTDGNFNPQNGATRAEACKIAAGLLWAKEGK